MFYKLKKKKIVVVLVLIATAIFCVLKANAQEIKAEEITSDDWTYGTYVINKSEADGMIATQGRLVKSPNDKFESKEFPFFAGYDPMTHQSVYVKTMPISLLAISTYSIKTVGTYSVGSYWGEIMQSSNGTPVYCGTYGASYPVGSFSYQVSENTKVRNALSWGYSVVNTSAANSTDYGKTQLALWKGKGQLNPSGVSLGVYEKVSQAYKGAIKMNNQTFSKAVTGSPAVIQNLNMSSAVKVSGTAKYQFSSATISNVKAKGANLYVSKSLTSGYSSVKAGTYYSTSSYPYIRMGSSDMSKNLRVDNVPFTTNVKEIAGYLWEIQRAGYQDIMYMPYPDPTTNYAQNFVITPKTGTIVVNKQMDDIDRYEGEVENSGKTIYSTKDGQPVTFKTELGEMSVANVLHYPTEEDMIANDMFDKPYEYEYLDYTNVTKTQDKLDSEGNKIAIADSNGEQPTIDNPGWIPTYDSNNNPIADANGQEPKIVNPAWIPTYEQETVNVIDEETGYPVVEAIKDSNGEYQYAKATTSFNLPNKDFMDNIYNAMTADNVEFTLLKSNKTTVVKTGIVNNGKLSFTGILPGDYYVKETKTKDGFNIITTMYAAKVTAGGTVTINGGKIIMNQINYSELWISKTDATGELELDGARMQLLDTNDDIVDEWVSKAGDPHLVKLSPGTYYIKEIIAPLGREKKTTLIPVNILENGEIIQVAVKNELIEVDVETSKVDQTGEKEIPGAKMCINREDNKEFNIKVDGKEQKTKQYCWTSTKQAKKYTLYYGKHIVTEKAAPKGYIKTTTKYPVNVTESGIKKVKVKNTAIAYLRTGGVASQQKVVEPFQYSTKDFFYDTVLN